MQLRKSFFCTALVVVFASAGSWAQTAASVAVSLQASPDARVMANFQGDLAASLDASRLGGESGASRVHPTVHRMNNRVSEPVAATNHSSAFAGLRSFSPSPSSSTPFTTAPMSPRPTIPGLGSTSSMLFGTAGVGALPISPSLGSSGLSLTHSSSSFELQPYTAPAKSTYRSSPAGHASWSLHSTRLGLYSHQRSSVGKPQ